MSHVGKKLEKWREALPRSTRHEVTARALSLALGWEASRWRQLEKLPRWTDDQRAEARAGVEALAARLEGVTPAEAWAGVEGGPWAPKAWTDSPELRRGRRTGTRLAQGRVVAVLPPQAPASVAAATVGDAARVAVEAGASSADRAVQSMIDEIRRLIRGAAAGRLPTDGACAAAAAVIRMGVAAAGVAVAAGPDIWEFLGHSLQ